MQLTTTQLKSLLLNARGFLDDYGTFLTCDELYFEDDSFYLYDAPARDTIYFKYANAELKDSKLHLEWRGSEQVEQLEVLIPLSEAQDISSFITPVFIIEE